MKTLKEVKQEYLERAQARPLGAYVVRDPATGKVTASSGQPFAHTFDGGATWIQATKEDGQEYLSLDGGYYPLAQLPEQSDDFVAERYAVAVRAERNARITDTDDYIRLPDITVEKVEGEPREVLTEAERQQVMAYREGLRNMPTTTGFPFVEYPALPACIAVECGRLINQREVMQRVNGGY